MDLSQYMQASFRGVEFHVAKSTLRIAHNLDKKSYPYKTRGLVTDMSVADDVFTLPIFLMGDDVLQRRLRLEDAFRVLGPGELVHPTRGPMQVCVESASGDELMTEFGIADYTVTFVLAGDKASPAVRLDTQAAALTAADDAEFACIAGYNFDVQSVDDANAVDADAVIKATVQLAQFARNLTPAQLQDMAFDTAVSVGTGFAALAISKVAPAIVGRAFSIAGSVAEYFGGSPEGVAAFVGTLSTYGGAAWQIVNAFTSGSTTATSTAQSRLRQITPVLTESGLWMAADNSVMSDNNQNTARVAQSLFDAVTVTAARSAITTTNYSSLNQALEVRDTVTAALSQASMATTSDDPVQQNTRRAALRGLRSSVNRDLSERAADLPILTETELQAATSRRAASYRLTDTLDGLNANPTRRPIFIPAAEKIYYRKA